MDSFAISTPSPPTRVHTPGSPKFGYNDSWEPYTPRKSARISAQRANHQRTPSPHASSQRRSRAITKSSSDASTPVASPQKKRQPAMDSVRRAPSAFSASSSSAAKSLAGGSSQQKSKPSSTASRSIGMLPTPAKTPQKEPDEKMKANVRAVARNLFSNEADDMLTPKRKAKKYSGLTLDSFTAEEVNNPIEIFTDSRDRVPVVDNADENPFYGDHAATPVQTRARGKQVSIPGEGKQDMNEVLHREDGIVYVFRGKKIFRKFSTGEEEEAESTSQAEDEDIESEFGTAASRKRLRPVTRSSIKPRLLFPPKKDKQPANTAAEYDEDEEAATDIEEHVLGDVEEDQMEEPVTPRKTVAEKPSTPVAPKFALSSPPTTVRTTRTTSRVHLDDTPIKPPKSHSPFDGWRRSKSRTGPHGQKREGEALTRPHEASKRQRA
ncbi:hypothetical protein F4821DRAFT_14143 [Hypoxylon rubiginosum]|uniref:Uncharacterized protein n=1 Tax=Hypoxylon rubiginosum TaxID=110542 RepID=A0ACC0CNX3_9PEZI|nr:hypothetical protein F4821DRAFT_14143 [Hypoxylon rubiginosum]